MIAWIANKVRGVQISLDVLLIALAWAFSYALRFVVMNGQLGASRLFVEWFFPLSLLTVYFLLRNQLYDQKILRPFASDAMAIMKANTTGLLVFIVLLYFASDMRISRITLVVYSIISTICLLFGRATFRSFVRKLRRRGYLLRRVFVVGSGPEADRYLSTIRYTPGTGLNVVGTFGYAGAKAESEVQKFDLSDLDRLLETDPPDIVVLGFADEAEAFLGKFMEKYYDSLFLIQILPAEKQAFLGLSAETFEDVHLLTLNQPQFAVTEVAAKRLIDFISSAIGLVLLSPLLALIGIIVKLSSPGPIFFAQERMGQDGFNFKMWKFRTMKVSTEPIPIAGWTVENDPRRTRIGTFLRSTSIDELPQLWNVFVGDMSLVGPRPEQPYFVEKFSKEIPAYMLRHKMKAGITGWAQVNGWRGDTSLHKRIECDLHYIRNWTLWFDCKILVMTFVKGFINKNAY